MSEKTLRLSELKEGIMNKEELQFSKTIVGGYSPKEVNEHIQALNQRLAHAESSFKNELDEYNSMVIMLKQERDGYIRQIKEFDTVKNDLKQKIEELAAEKNALLQKNDLLEESALSQKDLETFEETFKLNEELQLRINEYEEVKNENLRLAEEVVSLGASLEKQRELTEDLRKNQISQQDYDSLLEDYMLIKEQYDVVMTEKSKLVAEKNVMEDESLRMLEMLDKINREKRELREENTRIELNTRDKVFEMETKVYEYAQYHKKNIKMIRENIQNILLMIDSDDAIIFSAEDNR